jgi:hypothetical protein
MSPHRILRSSPLAGLLVLLLVGCGGNAIATGTNPSSPNVGSTATPPLEGTGPGSTSSGGGGGGGGAAVYFPGMPIGNSSGSSDGECQVFQWLGATIPSGVTVTITSVAVVNSPFTTESVAVPGCNVAACLGFQFNAANADGAQCYVTVQYTGSSPHSDDDGVPGFMKFDGNLGCSNTDSATCQQYSEQLTPTPQVKFIYYPPTSSPGEGSPGEGSPGEGSPGEGSPGEGSP